MARIVKAKPERFEEPPKAVEHRGMACTECGEPTSITDSRPSPRGIRRRRECKNGHRFTTIEVLFDERSVRAATKALWQRIADVLTEFEDVA